jgi:hypothetical protein
MHGEQPLKRHEHKTGDENNLETKGIHGAPHRSCYGFDILNWKTSNRTMRSSAQGAYSLSSGISTTIVTKKAPD